MNLLTKLLLSCVLNFCSRVYNSNSPICINFSTFMIQESSMYSDVCTKQTVISTQCRGVNIAWKLVIDQDIFLSKRHGMCWVYPNYFLSACIRARCQIPYCTCLTDQHWYILMCIGHWTLRREVGRKTLQQLTHEFLAKSYCKPVFYTHTALWFKTHVWPVIQAIQQQCYGSHLLVQ